MANDFTGLGRGEIRLAMLGMVEGNGHPYSWSAIFNGYDREDMARCPFPAISGYLDAQPAGAFGIEGVRVTHVWTDEAEDARRVAAASRIPTILARPEDAIGAVDAAVIATDIGNEHVGRCRPFVEAGVPIFVDKPLVDNAADLAVFRQWETEGRPILSGSALAYAREFAPFRESTGMLGRLRFASVTTSKSWERYGIHALSAVYPIVGPGFVSARNTGGPGRSIVHLTHRSGVDVCVAAVDDMYGGFGCVQLCGTRDSAQLRFADTFYAFKAQLEDFVLYLRTGARPFPWSETEELMRLVIAGIRSRDEGGREIAVEEAG